MVGARSTLSSDVSFYLLKRRSLTKLMGATPLEVPQPCTVSCDDYNLGARAIAYNTRMKQPIAGVERQRALSAALRKASSVLSSERAKAERLQKALRQKRA